MSIIKIVSCFALLSISTMSYAELSCHEINSLQNDLEKLVDEIDSTVSFNRDDVADLEELIDHVYTVAYTENNRILISAAKRMDRSWEREDPDSYADALDDVISELNETYSEDC